MLDFLIYDGDGPADEFPLQQAVLLGPADIAMEGEVQFEDGLVRCEKRTIESAALSLLVDVGQCGRLGLQTCLLPDRDQPYLLFLELARYRIKSFLVKIEDWMLFDLPADHPVLEQWEDARHLLTEAIILEFTKPAESDALARQSLEKAIIASENLTVMHADALLAVRYAEDRMPQRALGCHVHQSQFAEPLAKIMGRDFDFISIPIRWSEIEPEEGQYDWSKLDRWMDWAKKSNFPVIAGPIVDFREHSVPDWLYVWEHDYDTTHDLLHEHIEAIITRYMDVVSVWNMASSLHINTNFTLAYDELLDVVRMTTSLAKALHPGGRTMIEITEPWGEYYANNTKSIPPIVFAETLAQSGFKIDKMALNLQIGHHRGGRTARDLMQIGMLLDKLMYLDLPVVISGLGAPSHRPKKMNGADPGGYWRQPWSPTVQADWFSKVIALCMSKPFIESVCIHELYDHNAGVLPAAGLITSNGRAKPALTRVGEIHKELKAGTMRCSVPDERFWVTVEERDDQSVS